MDLNKKIERRNFLKGTVGLAGALTAGGAFLSVNKTAYGSTEVNIQLGWLASNGFLGDVVAKKLGYYKESGFDLKITPGGPGVDGVASVASGRAMLGQLSSSPSLMLARSAGIPIKCIAAGYQKHPFTYHSLKKNPIRSAKDMIGKTIATQKTAYILIRALLAKNNISEDQVNIVPMGYDMSLLMTGQVDAVTGWLTNMNALKVIGDQRVDLMLWDTGIQLYANVYYATDETLNKHFDTLAAFLRGSARGWEYAYKNPEKAVDILVETYPRLNREAELNAVSAALDFSFNEKTRRHGWANMEPSKWEAQIETYNNLNQFKGVIPKVNDVMTLDVLKATASDRPKLG